MKIRKKKVLAAYCKQYKGKCHNCGKFGHKSADPKYPEHKNENKHGKKSKNCFDEEKKDTQNFNGKCYHCEKIGYRREHCRTLLGSSNKAEQSLDKECN